MMEVFNQSGINPSVVDKVCLTGGTAQFPLIKREFAKIFGEEKLKEHDIFNSVVGGLAQYARFL
jgi:molecular chaperone DnaK (HSP70)